MANRAPTITSNGGKATAEVGIFENNTTVTTVVGKDLDKSDTLTYSIVGGDDAGRFSINSATGVLQFIAAPDFEGPVDTGLNNIYNLVVSVSDGSLTDEQAIAVRVMDAHEAATPARNPPVIVSDLGGDAAALSVAENTATVTTVVGTTPNRTAVLSYSLAGGADASKFEIDARTGVLSFKAPPDYEQLTDAGGDRTYDVVVQVSDGRAVDTQALAVSITDTNDGAPVFTSASAFKVAENTKTVGTVAAKDADAGGTIAYSLSGLDAGLFDLDGTGALSFKVAPDFEAPGDSGANNVYNVSVNASDGVNKTSQALTVSVTNANDSAPVFTSLATFSVGENWTDVGTVVATDSDPGDTVSYSLAGGTDAVLFDLDSATGALSFKVAPDFEAPADAGANNVYNVSIEAKAGLDVTRQSVAVTVTNTNDGAPTFTPNPAFKVGENTKIIGTVVATDGDAGTKLKYSMGDQGDSALFEIDPATGELSFKLAPDFEAPADAEADNVYNLYVEASDGENMSNQPVTVTVTNVNDAAPVFKSSTTFGLAENTKAVGTVAATDADSGTKLTYSLLSGGDAALFDLDAATGALSFKVAPDFEAPGDLDADNAYKLTVQASDGSTVTPQDVTVTVTNANDAAPVFKSPTTFSLAENTKAVGTVAATDADAGTKLSYSLLAVGDASLFHLDASTGALTFWFAPDFEAPAWGEDNVYNLTVQASDGFMVTPQDVTVTVTNVNDAPPVFPSSRTFMLAENTKTVGTIVATDADAGTKLTYSLLAGGDAALFDLDAATGSLSFKAAPDFEAPGDTDANNAYKFTVQASDGSTVVPQDVTVTVTNVNDSAPVFNSSTTFSLAENTKVAGTVAATDADGGNNKLSYQLIATGDAAVFALDHITGALTFKVAPDFEAPTDAGKDNVYNLTVQAFDGTTVTRQDVTVTVTNVNDTAPAFTSSAAFSLAENTKAVGTVVATDADGATALSYSLAGDGDAALFNIDSATGDLSFKLAPDFEAPADAGLNNVYNLTVQATDGSNSSSQSVAVKVVNANDIAPVSADGTIWIADVWSGGVGWDVFGDDADSTQLTFTLTEGLQTTFFGPLSFFSNGSYSFTMGSSPVGTSDSFSYTVSDSVGVSAEATMSILRIAGNVAYELIGGAGADVVYGGHAGTRAFGNGGDDVLVSGGGNDYLDGGAGDDYLDGTSGNDVLVGGAGSDRLNGQSGSDRFVFNPTDGTSRDFIEYFEGSRSLAAGGDVIDISALLIGYTSSATADFIRLAASGTSAILSVDANGSVGGANFVEIVLIGQGASLDLGTLLANGNLDVIV